jgi:hypothetical protein
VVESESLEPISSEGDLHIRIGVTPEKRDTREPVFLFDRLTDAVELFWSKHANRARRLGAGDFSANGARCNFDIRIVADAFAFPQFTVRHEVKPVVVFDKPDGCVHSGAIFAVGGKTDITLAVDFGGDGCHADIVKCAKGLERVGMDIFLEFPWFLRLDRKRGRIR